MIIEEAPLTDDERAHVQVLSRTLLAGQGLGFWVLANAVTLGCIGALLWWGVPPGEPDLVVRKDLALLLGPVWLALNGLYFLMRYRMRALRRDLGALVKQTASGLSQGVEIEGTALVYTLGGQRWRVRPALPIEDGFVFGSLTIRAADTMTGTPLAVQRSAHGERLLGVRHPTLDAHARLARQPLMSPDEEHALRRAAHRSGLQTAGLIGLAGLPIILLNGVSPWLALWLLPMAMMYAAVRLSQGPRRWVGWVEAQGPVTETLEATWHGAQRMLRQGYWVRVAGQLFPVSELPALGAAVRLRARLRADGFAGETTEFDTLSAAAVPPAADAQWGA